MKLNFEFCAVPISVLKRTDFTSTEKLLYSVLLGFQANGDSWASNEYLAEILGCNTSTIVRSLQDLERKGGIKRDTQQINKFKKERTIKALNLSVNPQMQNAPTEDAKCTSYQMQNAPRTQMQNAPILNKSLLNNGLEKEKSASKESPHIPAEILELKKKAVTMKDQLNTAEVVTDRQGRKRVKLSNGKVQDANFKNIFLTKEEKQKVIERFTKEFPEDYSHYLYLAMEKLNDWIDANKTKALGLSCHYRTLLKWPLADAKKAHIDDLRTFNAEQQKERYAR